MKLKILFPLLLGSIVFTFVGCGDDIVTPQYGNGQQISSDSNYVSSYTDLGEFIGNEKAKEIALNHAGVSADKIYDLDIELDRDYGAVSYEISFKSEGFEYDYDIDAYSGNIIRSGKETDY